MPVGDHSEPRRGRCRGLWGADFSARSGGKLAESRNCMQLWEALLSKHASCGVNFLFFSKIPDLKRAPSAQNFCWNQFSLDNGTQAPWS